MLYLFLKYFSDCLLGVDIKMNLNSNGDWETIKTKNKYSYLNKFYYNCLMYTIKIYKKIITKKF